MSDKKRKSASSEIERPSKKQQTGSKIRVSHVAGPDITKPVVASSPGVTFPDVKFQSFAKPNGSKTSLLLHSFDHPTLEHTAREDDTSVENHLKHYVAVFDPEIGKLEVTEAKRMTVRSAIRSGAATRQNDDEDEIAPVTNYTSRAALTAAFGTKKSKKAVQSMAENRLLSQGNGETEDPISVAILSTAADDDESSNQVSLADALSNKPLPTANLNTNEIEEVYSLDELVHPGPVESTLEAMPINMWIARMQSKKDVQTRSRFVANRVGHLVQQVLTTAGQPDPRDKRNIQVLRYIQLLIDLHKYVTHLPRRRPIPGTETWPDQTMSEGTPMSLLRPIVKHFFPDRTPKEYSITLLRTTIFALTLHIPPSSSGKMKAGLLVTEPTDISLDMAIEANEARRLYRELGCEVKPATEQDFSAWGLEKPAKKRNDETSSILPKPIFARLKFPLNFPKLSRGRPSARR